MKKLPKLIKYPNRKYVIGIDVVNEGNNEIFTFCVQFKEGSKIHIEQVDSLINIVDYKINSPTDQYIKELREYYNAPIYRGNGI